MKKKKKKKRKKRPLSPSSLSADPPLAIEISTPWEIIVRVSSASDLPRQWQPLQGLSPCHLFPLSGALGLASMGLWIPCWFCSVFVEHTPVNLPPLLSASREASRCRFCTLGDASSYVNTWSLVSGYLCSSCPDGPALWYCTLS